MEILATIYDKDLNYVGKLDGFKALLRYERFRNAGEFQMQIPAVAADIAMLFSGYFIVFSDDQSAYLIEDIEPDIDYGPDIATVSGRDLKALYDTRVIWKMQTVSGTAWNRMYWLLYYNAYNPTYLARKIPYLVSALEREGDDSGDSSQSQYTGDNLLTACIEILGSSRCGWRVELDVEEKTITNIFYTGTDRSNIIEFSDVLGNLSRTTYRYSIRDSANTALVAGEGEGNARTYVEVTDGSSGLDRRETFIDARDLQSETSNGDGTATTLTATEYQDALKNRGTEKLSEKQATRSLGLEMNDYSYEYKKDYYLGDIVRGTNRKNIGIDANCRVVAMQISDDADGHVETPSVEIVDMEVIA